MPSPTDKQLDTARGWPGGIDNLNKEQALARDETGKVVVALRDAENADLDRAGKPSRRVGYTKVASTSSAHSLWADPAFPFGLFVDAGRLTGVNEDASTFLIAESVGDQPMSCDVAAAMAYWSNASQNGRVSPDAVAMPWGVPRPAGAPAVEAVTMGGLHAGRYQVTQTFLSASGEESGAPEAALCDVAEGGGIAVTPMAAPDASFRRRLYMTGANGDVLYWATDMPPGALSATLGAGRLGKPLETLFLDVMPPGHIVRHHNGRMYVAVDAVLMYSEALRYGLTRIAHNRIGFQKRLAMLEPVGAGTAGSGLFVASGARTYWLPGTDPQTFNLTIAHPHGVVPGTSIRVPANVFGLESTAPVAYWLSDNGAGCLGLPGGTVVPLRPNQAIAPIADGGASLFRDTGDLRQVITTLVGAKERGLAVGDKLDCTVIRHDP